MSWTFDVAGPLAPGVEDLAWVLREIAGFDAEDSASVQKPTPNYVAALAALDNRLDELADAVFVGDQLQVHVV